MKKKLTKEESNKDPNIVYSEIEIKDDMTKPISFRVDSNVYKKIITLEKIKKETKSTIIKEAIDRTFDTMMFQHLNNEIYNIIKDVFPNVKILSNFMLGAENKVLGETDDDREKNIFLDKDSNVIRCVSFYKLDYPSYIQEKEESNFSLNKLSIEIIHEASNIVKLKISLIEVLKGQIDKINQEIFTNISILASKEGFRVETTTDKKNIAQTLFFERNVDFDYSKWLDKLKENLGSLKLTIEKINTLIKDKKEIKINNKKTDNIGMLQSIMR